MKNIISKNLIELGLSTENSFEPYSDKVRDSDDIKVFRCKKSQVIVLDYLKTNVAKTYEDKSDFSYWSQSWNKGEKEVSLNYSNISEDDTRRAELLKPLIKNKSLLDFGTGMGGVLRLLQKEAKTCHGLELQPGPRQFLKDAGIECFKDLSELPDSSYDYITLFHVFEHLEDPINLLKECKKKLKPNGKIIIEVPHARDVLLSLYESDKFKSFTLWSEHLILHTKESLRLFIEASGLKVQAVKGFQRYPVANHLHWLAKGLPGGQNQWPFLNSEGLHREYESMLASIDATDTIIAHCSL